MWSLLSWACVDACYVCTIHYIAYLCLSCMVYVASTGIVSLLMMDLCSVGVTSLLFQSEVRYVHSIVCGLWSDPSSGHDLHLALSVPYRWIQLMWILARSGVWSIGVWCPGRTNV